MPDDCNEEVEAAAKKMNVPLLIDALVEFRKKRWFGKVLVRGVISGRGTRLVMGFDFQGGIISQYQNLHVVGAPLVFTEYEITFEQNLKNTKVNMKNNRDEFPKQTKPIGVKNG